MIEETIARAKKLRREDDLEASQILLLDLLAEHPKHPQVLYEVGGSYDVLGEEKNAIPYYEKAIKAGLMARICRNALFAWAAATATSAILTRQ
ncbi:MAG: tetratricopeptide repeat protein [Ardenticatenaceae bacterium]|nr:tetratricopeptide repeat protein [Ardenticatenaceae bacterium]